MGNGWSNDIPNPFIVGGGGQSGEIDIVNGNGQLFMFMDQDGFFLIDPATNLIQASITYQNLDLPIYGPINAGIFTYDPGTTQVSTGLFQGQLQFYLTNQTHPFFNGVLEATNPGLASSSPYLNLQAPSTNAAPDQAFIQVGGNSKDGTDPAKIILGKTVPGDCEMLVWGTLNYGQIGSVTPEPFHDVAFASGWSNTGSGFRNVRYKRTPDGQVALIGLASHTGTVAAPSKIFTLPAGYRPDGTVHLTAVNQPSPTAATTPFSIEVATNGDVSVTNYSGTVNPGPISFEGMAFYLSGS